MLLIILLYFTVSSATVFLNQAQESLAVCRGTTAEIICTTTTGTGFLLWRDSSGNGFGFDDASFVGDNGTLGSINMTLSKIGSVSNAMVYTSKAMIKDKFVEKTTIQCSDGDVPQIINIHIKSPSSPSWAHSACSFSQNSLQLFWNAPSVAAECCHHYTIELSTGSVFISFQTSITIPIGNEKHNATVYCVDHVGRMVSKSINLTITSQTAIEHVTIGGSVNDDNVTYQIVWGMISSSQDICTPPITKSIIMCITPTTFQYSVNTHSMICSVTANETVNVTVTITNAAGVTVENSTSADALELACQRLMGVQNCTSSEPAEVGLSPVGIVFAVFVAFGIFLLMMSTTCVLVIKLFKYVKNRRAYYPNKSKYK